MRLLLDPSATEGGATETPAKTEAKAEVKTIPVDPTEFASLYQAKATLEARLAAFEAEKQAAIEAANQAHLAKLAEEQGAKAALDEQRRQLQERYDALAAKDAARDKALADAALEAAVAKAMAGKVFASDFAKKDAEAKLAAKVKVEMADGKPVVRDASSGRFASETLTGYLDTPEFAHLFPASTKGGSGATSASTASAEAEKVEAPKNLGEALVLAARQAKERGERIPGIFGIR